MNIYINRDGQQLGPFSLEEVRQRLASGQISGVDWAWPEGTKDWVPVQQVPGIGAPPPMVPSLPGSVSNENSSLLGIRLLTGFFIAAGSFFFIFLFLFVLSMFIGGAIAGAESGLNQQPQGFSQGYQVGAEAGRKFGQEYGPLFMLLSALLGLVLSLLLAWFLTFCGILPWCRTRKRP